MKASLYPTTTVTAPSEHLQQRFLHEADVLARLVHPNIVPACDLGHEPEGSEMA